MTATRVLVIEDEPVIGELLCEVLHLYEIEARGVLSGREGLAAAGEWAPDAVILDLMLPDVNGYEVCQALKSDPRTRDIGVMILTGMLAHADRARAFASGADRFLTKPFQPDDVMRELNALIRHRRSNARAELVFDFLNPGELARQVRQYRVDLVRCSPLASDMAESLGEAVLALGENYFAWRERERAAARVTLICRVFVDHLEHTLALEPTGSPGSGPAALRTMLEASTLPGGISIRHALTRPRDAGEPMEDGHRIVFRLWFAAGENPAARGNPALRAR